MPLILVTPYKKSLLNPTNAISGRTVRLTALAARNSQVPRGSMVGVFEFELRNAANQNLCRLAGFIPTIYASPEAYMIEPHGADNAIDGVFSGDWNQTCYMAARADGKSFLEFTFAQDITPTNWRMVPEGVWLPTASGMKLELFKNGAWINITGTPQQQDWTSNAWRNFTIPAIP